MGTACLGGGPRRAPCGDRAIMPAVRILHLVGRSHRRGAEQVARELAEELDHRGHHSHLVAVSLGHEGGRDAALPPLVARPDQGAIVLVRAAVALRRELRGWPAEVILAHGAAATLVAVLAVPRRGPVVVWQRILALTDASRRGVLGAVWRIAVRRVDGVVALTDDLGDEVRRLGYRGPVWRIANGRRTERFEGLDRDRARATLGGDLGVGAEVALVGLVGYLVDQKRPERAVEVLAGLRGRGVDAHLVVAGSGPLAGPVAEAAARLGVAAHVSLLGHRDDVEQILAALDVLILTSDDEGIPGIVVEAAMAGCPVVTYPLGGVAEVVAHDETGLVLGESSVTLMADAVAGLVRDPVRRAAMADAARAHSGAFAMEVIAERYEDHLGSLVAGHRYDAGRGGSVPSARRAPR